MKTNNIFKSTALMSKKEIKSAKAETKKGISAALKDYESAINGAYNQVVKSSEKRARDAANAAKGKYKTAIDVVANCFPFQTENGTLCRKAKDENGSKVWAEKKLTAAAARGIVRDALKHFTDTLGSPCPQVVVIGEAVK